jgi:hypothetical protein
MLVKVNLGGHEVHACKNGRFLLALPPRADQ